MTPLFTIDVAHPPRSSSAVEQELHDAWQHVRHTPGLRLLKVIHGYGSTGGPGSTRETTRNWAYNHRRHFRAIIDGEEYSLFDASTRELRSAVGPYDDPDLDSANRGILVIWIH